ncbi:UvrD-helicase domain-containing protein [Rhodococcus sp. ACPA4]|uniref:UvrD-helicase domain-containing protein n=1 Tax=Rhodococcus sp. ACPA4 TaxID=2028571 RepID=UPI001179BDDB|nr:UvrD-helicase domain-containing protein [Rhodococcus sp. ACPA4]
MTSSAAPASDGPVEGLTEEQLLAAGSRSDAVFIEAGPGTGKTSVSAHRFAAHRFDPAGDPSRAVVAVSFTRAATSTLKRRVQRLWGPAALTPPHRIVTLDTLIGDLLHDLLRDGIIEWPNGHSELDVHDSWSTFSGSTFNRTAYRLSLAGNRVQVEQGWVRKARPAIPATGIVPRLLSGICTHDDVRVVLEAAIKVDEFAAYVRDRLCQRLRALIVDEVFDANDLDLAIIEMAMEAGIATTFVGDPWQALYVFRGARPEAVRELVARRSVRVLPLTRSFRWTTEEQRSLAEELRAGRPGVIPALAAAEVSGCDAVLALNWKPLWELSESVLPFAFQSFRGTHEEAAATLVLSHVTRTVFGTDATYLREALTSLAITDDQVLPSLRPAMQVIMDVLSTAHARAPIEAYELLRAALRGVSPRVLRNPHPAHTGRLRLIQQRLVGSAQLIPGLTTHQAKGQEWDLVGFRLTEEQVRILAGGLDPTEEEHRKLYVGATRARAATRILH